MTTGTARLGTARQVPLAALPTAPRMGRVLVENAGAAWHIPDDALETAKLLMSEFVTNGVFRTGRADGSAMPAPEEHVAVLHARVELHRDVIRVAVWDSDPSAPVVQTPTDESESGRGLVLVTALARNWGFYFPPAGGKVVWADIVLNDSGEASSPDPARHWATVVDLTGIEPVDRPQVADVGWARWNRGGWAGDVQEGKPRRPDTDQ